jgi:hypothetical protein
MEEHEVWFAACRPLKRYLLTKKPALGTFSKIYSDQRLIACFLSVSLPWFWNQRSLSDCLDPCARSNAPTTLFPTSGQPLGAVSGAMLGFIFGNVPGALAGGVAGGYAGKIRGKLSFVPRRRRLLSDDGDQTRRERVLPMSSLGCHLRNELPCLRIWRKRFWGLRWDLDLGLEIPMRTWWTGRGRGKMLFPTTARCEEPCNR